MLRGSLFTLDFLEEGVVEQPEWRSLGDEDIALFAEHAKKVFAGFPISGDPNEDQTEDDLIHPIAELLGWKDRIPQANLTSKGRRNVPDALLFSNAEAKNAANAESQNIRKFLHGLAILEAKKWTRALDKAGSDGTPSSQILRYLHHADIHSERRIKWGILTNGRKWRLYWQDAKSRLEDFLELDLPVILGVADVAPDDLFSTGEAGSDHHLRLFILMFRRESFLPAKEDARSFHLRAVEATRDWEASVADDLSGVVFEDVFPHLIRALVRCDPAPPAELTEGYLEEVRRSALVLLYRLLFVLYAEDRNLLPVHDQKYDDYALNVIRRSIADRVDIDDDFSDVQDRYYAPLKSLFRAIDRGDQSIGLPPYNGGLFEGGAYPLLDRVSIPDEDMSRLIDALSRREERAGGPRKWINYRDLSVRQLGSIYERLLERTAVPNPSQLDGIEIRLNIFARKGSGSYYTPDDIVELIVTRTLQPLIDERWAAFEKHADQLAREKRPVDQKIARLLELDPATSLLDLRICDPAMGSGHFLVFVVDHLADTVLRFVEEAEALFEWGDYKSPLTARIAGIRERIVAQADEKGWTIDEERLEPRHIVRRMILKRSVYGVDKNPMAVELAKVSLWLHTFTVGAPLSFLDHHLRCGDSLYGEFVRPVEDAILAGGFGLFIDQALKDAKRAAKGMSIIENLTDIDVAEVGESAQKFSDVEESTGPLARFFDFFHALRWLDKPVGKKSDTGVAAILDGHLGDPVRIVSEGYEATEEGPPPGQGSLIPEAAPEQMSLERPTHVDGETRSNAADLLRATGEVAARERFLHWQVAFPGVWENWGSAEPAGGFDAVVGNPPWDRIKLQEVEWFAARRPEIAKQARASDRKRLIGKLEKDGDPLWEKYLLAKQSAEAALGVARTCGAYPLLSSGDINLYSLFVERVTSLVKPAGMVGLLVPSGISADKGASKFFKGVATTGRLNALFDFENKKVFFPEVDSRFKFCAFILGGPKRTFDKTDCAFFLHDMKTLGDPDRAFSLNAEDFARVNPNTGTAPIFRTRRDAEITRGIYERLPVLHDHAKEKVWPVKYLRMFDMTNDAGKFRTRAELEADGYYAVAGNRLKKGGEEYVPLFVGRMIHQFDHRAAGVDVNEANVHNAALSVVPTAIQRADTGFNPEPQYWVQSADIDWLGDMQWSIGFRDIARVTDVRTVISTIVPYCAAGNTLPLLVSDGVGDRDMRATTNVNLQATLSSFAFDYIARQKVQSTHLNWYILEQLPVVPPDRFARKFGPKTAAEIVREHVLHLTYTAGDMKPFAEDMGFDGDPFVWDDEDRRRRRAILDGLFFHLYGVEDEDDVRYILSTFPIVKRQDEQQFGRFVTEELIINYMRALAAGDPDAEIRL